MLNRQVILYISNSYQKVLLSIDTGFFTASDGKYRPATYATRKGLEYIRKMLSKQNKLCTE